MSQSNYQENAQPSDQIHSSAAGRSRRTRAFGGEYCLLGSGLMRQWVLVGMERFRVSEAIRSYQEAEVDLRGAAERAGLPVAVLLEEMAIRKVAVLNESEDFGAWSGGFAPSLAKG